MQISSIRIKKAENEGRVLAYVGLVADNAIAIHNIRIVKGDDKNFIAFPSIKKFDKETNESHYSDIVHPLNSETRKIFEDAIFAEYNKLD